MSDIKPLTMGGSGYASTIQAGDGLYMPRSIQTISTSSSTLAINVNLGSMIMLTLNHNIDTLTFSTPTDDSVCIEFILNIKQDGTGGRTVSWSSATNVKFNGDIAPVIGVTAGATTKIRGHWTGARYEVDKILRGF